MKFLKAKKRYDAAKRKHGRRLRVWSHHPLVVPPVIFVMLMALSVVGYHILAADEPPRTDAKVVIISHDHVQQTVPSIEPTVGALLQKLNITLKDGDVVEPAADTKINQDDFRINIYRAVPVEIVDGAHKTFTFSAATTSRSIAAQANIEVHPEDAVATLPSENFLRDGAIGQRVVIHRATPVHLNLYGTPIPALTQAHTVGEFLKEKHITLTTGDTVQPAIATAITSNMHVAVIHNGTKVFTVTEEISPPVKSIYDNNLAYGTTAVRQKGTPGEKVVTYKVVTKNGKEVSRSVLQTAIISKPVQQIVVVGTNLAGIKGDMGLAGIAPGDYQYADYIISHESGWCPTKWQGEYGGCPAYHGAPTSSYVGYGLCQATPGYKMVTAGSDWATNPITQLRWCSGYATGRYGSWYNAYTYWINHGNW